MARQYEKGIYCLNIQGSNGQEIYHLGGANTLYRHFHAFDGLSPWIPSFNCHFHQSDHISDYIIGFSLLSGCHADVQA